MKRTDFHSHILPGMDDGAKNTEMSVAMLKKLYADGVETVVLTPHFYRKDETISHFLERRAASYKKLCDTVEGMENCPKLLLGAEVYFYPSLSSDPDFGKLSIEGTDYVLLELPFEHFYHNFFSSYSKFMNSCSQKLILAHIERYTVFGNTVEEFEQLLNFGKTVCQLNCGSAAEMGLFDKKKTVRLIRDGYISVLGTDAHNTDSRPPLFGKAEKKIISKFGEKEMMRICSNSEAILDNAPISKII